MKRVIFKTTNSLIFSNIKKSLSFLEYKYKNILLLKNCPFSIFFAAQKNHHHPATIWQCNFKGHAITHHIVSTLALRKNEDVNHFMMIFKRVAATHNGNVLNFFTFGFWICLEFRPCWIGKRACFGFSCGFAALGQRPGVSIFPALDSRP